MPSAPMTGSDPARPETKRQRKIRKNPPIATDVARNFRCPDDNWLQFSDACHASGVTMSEAIRQFVDWYSWADGATMPKRPRLETLHDLDYLREQAEQKRAARLDGAA